jgi:hypothetical protein
MAKSGPLETMAGLPILPICGQDSELKHEAITKSEIAGAFEVVNGLGVGFRESVQENAMLLAPR